MDQQIFDLLKKYSVGECSAQELELVKQILAKGSNDAEWQTVIADEAKASQHNISPADPDFQQGKIYARIKDTLQLNEQPKVVRLWPRIAAAASIILAISAGSYFLIHKKPQQQLAQTTIIKPGSKKAILTLANGQQINLTDAKTGTVAQQAGTTVVKTAGNQVVYGKADVKTQEIVYNSINTPRGGFYPLQMPDGTLAILDAQSSIKYPVNGPDRTVEITGQVYFEVKYDAVHPFKVKVRGQVIEDLGTVFNINAYEDEPVIRTTLAEGSIRLLKNDQLATLVPGQQAVTQPDNNLIKIRKVDVSEAIAWKNGKTSFSEENIQEIMRHVSRWYDIDVRYEGAIPERHFDGGIPRNANLQDLLKVLEFNNVHFTLSGRTLTVKP